MLTRKLLSLLMSLLLTLSPFASIEVAAAIPDKAHCMMMGSDSAATDLQHAHGESSHTMPACKHCNDDNGCNNKNCSDSGCSSSHSLYLLSNTITPAQHHSATRHSGVAYLSLPSRSSPPLLRPPV